LEVFSFPLPFLIIHNKLLISMLNNFESPQCASFFEREENWDQWPYSSCFSYLFAGYHENTKFWRTSFHRSIHDSSWFYVLVCFQFVPSKKENEWPW
jgi:hypothetical protein